MFDLIIKEVTNRFNLGDKALPLVQVLVAVMTHQDTGGLTGFIERLKGNGLGNLVDSWMNSSAPLSINHVQIEAVLGSKGGIFEAIETRVGLDKGTALLGLAYLLPSLFNKLAPGGKVVSANSELAGFTKKGLALLNVELPDETKHSSSSSAPAPMVQAIGMIDTIVAEARNRFNLGDKASPLVQVLVAAMTHKKTGGLTGFIERFKDNGLESLVDSWINSSAPLNINHVQINEVLGGKDGVLEAIQTNLGLDKSTALLGLAYIMPNLINKLAPGGILASSANMEVTVFAEKGLALLGEGSKAAAKSVVGSPVPVPKAEAIGMFDPIVNDVSNRFNFGDKALPLVQLLVAAMIRKETGGLTGFIERFKNNGLGNLVDSWMNSSAPLSINHVQIKEVLGGKGGVLDAIDSKVGLDKGSALLGLAYLLPDLFSKLAPGGKVTSSLSDEVTRFAEKGIALLGVGSAVASGARASAEPVTPMPVTRSYTEKLASADKTVVAATEPNKGGILKYLLWLIPIALGLLLFKTCSKMPDETVTTSESTPVPTVVDSATPTAVTSPAPAAPTPVAPLPESAPTKQPSAAIDESATPAPNTNAPTVAPAETSSVIPTSPVEVTAPEPATTLPGTKIYFEVSKTDLPADTDEKLLPIINYLKANSGAKVAISGFHDPTGILKTNQKLAKNRALKVRAKLLAVGVAKKAIVLEKPQSDTVSGSNEEARRVEVNISK